MDSKAIAIMIVGLGVILLIVSAAVGAPSDGTIESFSGWPVEAEVSVVPTEPMPLKRTADRAPPRSPAAGEYGHDLSCTVAIKFVTVQSAEDGYCVLTGLGSNAWRCAGELVHHCIGDFPPADPPPPDILETGSKVVLPPS